MQQLRCYGDDRNKRFCVHCGGPSETVDHVPSKVLMDKPYPENLMAVPACRECNNGLSLDEEYLACFLECVIAGDTAPEKLHRAKIGRILRANCSLLARLQVARMDGVEGTIWVAENDRVSRVILKLARCHAAFGPAGKIRVKTGHFINFYSGRAVQVGIASGFKLVG